MNSLNELWEMVMQECKELVSESIFNVWLNDIKLVSFDENKVVLSVSGFKKKIVEARFLGKIKQAFYNVRFRVPGLMDSWLPELWRTGTEAESGTRKKER